MKLTNKHNLPLSVAAWLVHDNYEYASDPNYISVTTLLKPIKQIILGRRIEFSTVEQDIMDLFAVRLGQSLHDSIEHVWQNYAREDLEKLGINQATLDRMSINGDNPMDNVINITMENRIKKTVGKWTVSGKYDFNSNGQLEDFKSVPAFSYLKQSNREQYIQQGSIYRWLDPSIVTEETIQINYLIKDWKKFEAKRDREYPSTPIKISHYPLWSVEQTDAWVKNRLAAIEKYMDLPEEQIPECNEEELWRKPPTYKYFKNPDAARSTANYSNYGEALQKQLENNGVGIIKTVGGEVKRCHYCNAFTACQQKNNYLADGSLKLEE